MDRQRGIGRGHGTDIQRENVAPQGTLLAVAIEFLMGILGTDAVGGGACFSRNVGAAQAVAAHRATHGYAATRRHFRRTEKGHAAGARAVYAAGRPLQYFYSPDDSGVEQVERRAATGFGERDAVVVHLHVAHAERRAQRATPNAEPVAGRGPLLQPHAGQRIHRLGEGSGAELRNHVGIDDAHGGGGAAQRQPLAVAGHGGFGQGYDASGIRRRLGRNGQLEHRQQQ